MKDAIHVSHEMTTFVGHGRFPDSDTPDESAIFYFDDFSDTSCAVLGYRDDGSLDGLHEVPLAFAVSRKATLRIFGFEPEHGTRWHLSSNLRALALSLIECDAQGEARTTLQLARSIELLCQVHAALAADELVAICGDRTLSDMDVARVANARRIVDERWDEKLTIAELATMAGINRDKLARGFRELYNATIADVLAERRLAEARRILLTTDLPVASVAYRCSYLNNASFTRAFTRRFGVAPTEMRRIGVAA